jgi:hypothetical protein
MVVNPDATGTNNSFILLLIFNIVNSLVLVSRFFLEIISNLASI